MLHFIDLNYMICGCPLLGHMLSWTNNGIDVLFPIILLLELLFMCCLINYWLFPFKLLDGQFFNYFLNEQFNLCTCSEILAMDNSAKRSEVMAEILGAANVKNAKIKVADFSAVDVNAKPYSLVEYILLDPSCSGSGNYLWYNL